ncbi:uncharacterized protein LOC111318967 [Stylophora pistillata]|uniref:uncharacterized protein LOC111318967 n=1 Tax=Stylophora pistillata TaxID=50429 RepID=UPI000C039E46|nr:uncharacterized protein LOC111318967 [Stylophora pistillata]
MSVDGWILLMALCTFLDCILVLQVQANDVSYCVKKRTYPDVILQGRMEAGTYTPWEPGDLSHMTVDKCTKHCCKSPDTDVVFLLNSFCFCVKCHSLESCTMVKITSPSTYRPVTVTVMKRKYFDLLMLPEFILKVEDMLLKHLFEGHYSSSFDQGYHLMSLVFLEKKRIIAPLVPTNCFGKINESQLT